MTEPPSAGNSYDTGSGGTAESSPTSSLTASYLECVSAPLDETLDPRQSQRRQCADIRLGQLLDRGEVGILQNLQRHRNLGADGIQRGIERLLHNLHFGDAHRHDPPSPRNPNRETSAGWVQQ